jgi:hypothetical protein
MRASGLKGQLEKALLPPRQDLFVTEEADGNEEGNRPFLFLIVHNETRTVLFIGQVMDPR